MIGKKNGSNFNVKWKKINENIVFQNKFLTLRNDDVELPNKRIINQLSINTKNFSTVLCKTSQNKVVMIRQYRYPFESFSWECPGGLIDHEESPIDCAKREVNEETGYKVIDIHQVQKSHPSAMFSSWGFTFLAMVEKIGDQKLDKTEFIKVKEFNKNEIQKLIKVEKLIHGPSLLAWLMAQERKFLP